MPESQTIDGPNSAYLDLSGENRAPGANVPDDVRVVIVQSGGIALQTAANTSSEPFDFTNEFFVRDLVTKLQSARIQKLLCRPAAEAAPPVFAQQLRRGGIDPVFLSPADDNCVDSQADNTTTAEDFMDAADADAVAERLRALGYL